MKKNPTGTCCEKCKGTRQVNDFYGVEEYCKNTNCPCHTENSKIPTLEQRLGEHTNAIMQAAKQENWSYVRESLKMFREEIESQARTEGENSIIQRMRDNKVMYADGFENGKAEGERIGREKVISTILEKAASPDEIFQALKDRKGRFICIPESVWTVLQAAQLSAE